MATRAFIAGGDSEFPTWASKAVYHHWDGYPDGLGEILLNNIPGVRGNVQESWEWILKEGGHGGWSTLEGNWALEPTWYQYPVSKYDLPEEEQATESYKARGAPQSNSELVVGHLYNSFGIEFLYWIDYSQQRLVMYSIPSSQYDMVLSLKHLGTYDLTTSDPLEVHDTHEIKCEWLGWCVDKNRQLTHNDNPVNHVDEFPQFPLTRELSVVLGESTLYLDTIWKRS